MVQPDIELLLQREYRDASAGNQRRILLFCLRSKAHRITGAGELPETEPVSRPAVDADDQVRSH
jgi:hypothetical protein